MSPIVPRLDIRTLHTRYAAGDPRAELATVLAEIRTRFEEVADPGIFISLRDHADLLAEAQNLPPFDPALQPLWGIPFAVKDNIDVTGLPTTAACPAFAYEPAQDAVVVARLRAAGAIVLGKTNLDQFATGLVGVRTPYPIPRNALDPELIPGGSSSGSAVAVAQGLASFALGTDTAGSGRVPAALNGIVGLKPSLGRLSATGVVPACRTLDTISIFATGVADAATVLAVAESYDVSDPYSRVFAPLDVAAPEHPVVGVPDQASREFFGDLVQAQAFEAAVERLRALGAEVREIDLSPFFAVARMLYEGAWVAERLAAIEPMLRERPNELHPVTRGIIGAAAGLTAVQTFRGFYRLAELRRATDAAIAGLGLLCVPTIPTFYNRRDVEADPIGPNSRLGTYTNFVNLLDLCGLAVPAAPRADGRPGHVTLLAAAGKDGLLAAMAARIEADAGVVAGATGHVPLPLAAVSQSRSQSRSADETLIAVVGAHMTGLPLNGELTRLGARFCGPSRTAPIYRLFALSGAGVPRPGMLQVSTGGVALDLELWALPTAQVGQFLAGVPVPLSIGTVALSDGRTCKGFLVEAAAVQAACDISRFGGWRGFLASGMAEAVG